MEGEKELPFSSGKSRLVTYDSILANIAGGLGGGIYGVDMNMSPKAPKVGLWVFCTTICQGSAVKKVIYIYTYLYTYIIHIYIES